MWIMARLLKIFSNFANRTRVSGRERVLPMPIFVVYIYTHFTSTICVYLRARCAPFSFGPVSVSLPCSTSWWPKKTLCQNAIYSHSQAHTATYTCRYTCTILFPRNRKIQFSAQVCNSSIYSRHSPFMACIFFVCASITHTHMYKDIYAAVSILFYYFFFAVCQNETMMLKGIDIMLL